METTSKPVSSFLIGSIMGVVYGLVNGLSFALWESKVPLEAAKKGSGGAATLLTIVIAVALVVVAHQQYKKRGDGFMSYGKGLLIALFTGLAGAIVSAIIYFVYLKFINPDYLESIKDFAMNEATKNSQSEEGTETAEKIMGYILSPGAMAFFTFLRTCFMFLIIGLIVSIFTKKESAPAPF